VMVWQNDTRRYGTPWFGSKENENWRAYDNLQSEADTYKDRAERFKSANEYLIDRERLRDISEDPKTGDYIENPEGTFTGNPSRWFKGKK
jgi:hypothetical protein